jgi:acylphosphatase
MRRVRVRVDGRVQGVFFRATCRRRADELGLGGWVRNTPDGGVEAIFEGDPDAVQAILQWCREGPPHADVDSVEVVEEPPAGDRPPFRVR